MKTEAEEFDGCNGEEDHDCFTENTCCAERTAYIGNDQHEINLPEICVPDHEKGMWIIKNAFYGLNVSQTIRCLS